MYFRQYFYIVLGFIVLVIARKRADVIFLHIKNNFFNKSRVVFFVDQSVIYEVISFFSGHQKSC